MTSPLLIFSPACTSIDRLGVDVDSADIEIIDVVVPLMIVFVAVMSRHHEVSLSRS